MDKGSVPVKAPILDLCKELVEAGAGEIILNAVSRDGLGTGFDLSLAEKLDGKLDVRIILAGGAGSFDDFADPLKHSCVSAVAAGNIFAFSELSYANAKDACLDCGLPVRPGAVTVDYNDPYNKHKYHAKYSIDIEPIWQELREPQTSLRGAG